MSNLDLDATLISLILTIQKVEEFLVVDLDVGALYYEFYVFIALGDCLEYALNCAGD